MKKKPNKKKGTGRRPAVPMDGPNWRTGLRAKGVLGPKWCPVCATKRWYTVKGAEIECQSCYSRHNLKDLDKLLSRKRAKRLRREEAGFVHKVVNKESFKTRVKRIWGKKIDVD